MKALTTQRQIDTLKKPGLHKIERGLFLRIRPSGNKYWIQKISAKGRQKEYNLGNLADFGLTEARRLAAINAGTVAVDGHAGVTPKSNAPTFREMSEQTLTELSATWTSKESRTRHEMAKWRQRVRDYIEPQFGSTPIDLITKDDVLNVLRPLGGRKLQTTVMRTLSQTFETAIDDGHVESNPIDLIKPNLKRMRRRDPLPRTQHRAALPHREIPGAIAAIKRQTQSSDSARLALLFVILTGCRSEEVRGAQWAEMDMASKVWTIPAERMKKRREFRVPLSPDALDVLEQAKAANPDSSYCFPSPTSPEKIQSSTTLLNVLGYAGLKGVTVHGFRSSFRNWCGEAGKQYEIAEAALSHDLGDETVKAYFRSDLFEQRRELMNDWSVYAVAGLEAGEAWLRGFDGGELIPTVPARKRKR